MSKRTRDKSPVSENTIFNNLIASGIDVDDGELSDSFVNAIDSSSPEPPASSDSEYNDDSDDSLLELFGDDIDADPDYIPSDLHTTSDEENIIDQPSTSRGRPTVLPPKRPRGRPKTSTQVPHNRPVLENNIPVNPVITEGGENVTEDNAIGNIEPVIWEPVEEGNDPGIDETFIFDEIPGPKHCPDGNSKPIDYFYLFFTVNLLTRFVDMTNLYARNYLRSHDNLSPNARARSWKPVTVSEMKGFLATIFNMGIVRKPTIESYWSTNELVATPWFRKMFSRNRFESLLQFFHLVDNRNLPRPGEPNYDPSAKFQPLVDHANRVFRTHYTPHRELSVDESLIGTKSRSKLTQYLPNKHHHRWGIKLWMLCDSVSKYCLGFSCYKGKLDDGKAEHGLAHKVVIDLLKLGPYLNKGFSLYVDNFFMSLPLADNLFSNMTYVTGTMRRNRKGIPEAMKGKFNVGQRMYKRRDHKLMLAYREKVSQKNPVLLLSTKCVAKSIQKRKIRNNVEILKEKPEMIDLYNSYMGGIDHSDQMLYVYLDERRTVKYWKKVVFNIFARMILNLYIIYKENNTGKDMSRLQFTLLIIEELSKEWLEQRNAPDPLAGGDHRVVRFGMETLPDKKERNCSVCSPVSLAAGGKRKKSRTICVRCGKGVHPVCFGQHKC